MTNEEKVKVFEKELDFIKSPNIRLFAETAIGTLPDYIFTVSSSSTNKYHPQFALGEGGLIKHMRACARFAMECFRLEWYNDFTNDEKDLIITALLIHDGAKSGIPQTQWTTVDHPIVICNYLRSQDSLRNIIQDEQFEFILSGILSHMGAWNKDRSKNEIMPKPKTKSEKLIHWIDYVCSRRCLEMNFDVEISSE
jgi:hypothetical protein